MNGELTQNSRRTSRTSDASWPAPTAVFGTVNTKQRQRADADAAALRVSTTLQSFLTKSPARYVPNSIASGVRIEFTECERGAYYLSCPRLGCTIALLSQPRHVNLARQIFSEL